MNWLLHYLTSSIGRKITMSLTGIFMILFLIVHLLGNLQMLKGDDGTAFNEYAHFMTHNPLITLISYGLYFFIVLHTIQGLALWAYNRKAKGQTYAVSGKNPKVTWASQNMALLGSLILFFIIIHMGDFWWKMHNGQLNMKTYEGYHEPISDLYQRVAYAFTNPILVVTYVLGMGVLYFHLSHGFQSAFQTLGWNHPKYTPIIKGAGTAYAILVSLGFAIIPIIFFFTHK
jgi:succinate dehydrogenase / fumarate reductase, cytochrome b subunit